MAKKNDKKSNKSHQGKQTRAPKKVKKESNKKIVKSNFLTAKPNVRKKEQVIGTYDLYLKSINKFIPIFENEPSCYLSIFNLGYKDDVITKLEAKHRDKNLGSAYS
jgi:hypothetical protein